MSTVEFLQGQLERLFELDGMMALSSELLGVEPAQVGGTSAKGTFARALVRHCASNDDLTTLAEAIRLSASEKHESMEQLANGDEELAAGSEVRALRIVEVLERGPLATVYLATSQAAAEGEHDESARCDEPSAPTQLHVKVYRRELTRDRIAAWRLLTSARALKAVRDPGVVAIVDAGTLADGRVFVIEQALSGQTLEARVARDGALPMRELRSVARGFLRGLAALHEAGFVHGHLSPEHVLVTRASTGRAGERGPLVGVLSDLASARLLEGGEAVPYVVRLVGDPRTLAPEVARGQPLTPASEVYAAGCILYHALTGTAPFSGDTPIDQVMSHLYEEPQLPSARAPHAGITPELDELLLRALDKDVQARFTSARQLADALEALARLSTPPETVSQHDLMRVMAALHESPSDAAQASELEQLVSATGEWQQAADAFTGLAEVVEDPDAKKSLLFRAARILADELADLDGAEHAYREVLALDPADAQAQNALEELYRAEHKSEALIALLLDRLESETGTRPRAALLREVAALYEDALKQHDAALVAWTQALCEEPEDERARRAVERLAKETPQLEDVIASLRDSIIESTDPVGHALPLSVIVGEWYMRRLGRLDAALPFLSDALRIDPANEAALAAMTDLYRSASAWEDLSKLLLKRADVTTNPIKRREFLAEAGTVAHGKLGDDALAQRVFEEVLADDPAHAVAVSALEEIYADAGNLDKLVALLEQKARELRGSARALAQCELAELYEDNPETQRRALELYQSALAIDERCTAAYDGLERIYVARGEHAELLELLDLQRRQVTTPQQQATLLERMGGLLERELGDPLKAIERYEQIIELLPAHDGANGALARLYRAQHRFEDLVQTYDRHAKGVDDKEQKVELLMQEARVLMADIGSPERAAFVCERVLAVAPDHPEALALTARIHQLSGDTVAALDALELLADTEQDPRRKADLWVRSGKMVEDGGDLDGAIERYKLALEALPGHSPAFDALARVYDQRGDARGEAELLLRRADMATEPGARVAYLVALGKVRLEKLHDRRLAAEAFRSAHEIDPYHRDVLLGLGELALSDQRWGQAVSLLEPLLEQQSELPSDIVLRLLISLGDAYRALEHPDRAERAYLRARALAPNDRALNERIADIAIASGRQKDACEALELSLDRGGSMLTSQDRAALLVKLGYARLALDELDRAAAAFSAASELDPDGRDPLEGMATVQEKQGNTEALSRTLQRMLLQQEGGPSEERFSLLVRVGDLSAQLKLRDQAARFYVSALELHADDRNLLSKLMAVYSDGKDWAHLVEVLVRLANVVDEPALCAKYLSTAAGITAAELDDVDGAIEYYETALGFDPELEGGFEALAKCLRKAGAWDRLASAYRRQIEQRRDALDDHALATLWDELGAIYMEQLHRLESAVEAYETAAELSPESRDRLERLVELYGRMPSRFAERAIAAHAQLLDHNPYRVESYRALRKLYTQLSRPDEAWTVCQALRSLNMAEPEEESFYKRHRVLAPAHAHESITDALWQDHVLLADQDASLTSMLALMQPAAVEELSQPHADFGVSPEQAIDCERDPSMAARMLHYASGLMLVPLPPVFQRPRDPGGVSLLFTNPPAIGLGQGAQRGSPEQAVAFIVGRQLSYLRPGHFMRQLLPTGSGLRGWVLAAIRLANPRFPVPDALTEQVERNRAALTRTLHAPQQQMLTSYVERLLRDQPELDMKRWALAVDLAADRIGFVLANSLDAAVAMVRASPQESSYASERDRLKALYQYAVSPQYLALRRALGISIG